MTYEINLNMGWRFIVTASSEAEAMDKISQELNIIGLRDGYSHLAYTAGEQIKSSDFTIVEFDGWVLN